MLTLGESVVYLKLLGQIIMLTNYLPKRSPPSTLPERLAWFVLADSLEGGGILGMEE